MDLKELRGSRGLRQFEVVFEAKRRGVSLSRGSLVLLEQGKTKRLTLDWLPALAQIYNCSLDELMEAIFASRRKNETM